MQEIVALDWDRKKKRVSVPELCLQMRLRQPV